jgi:hypothetical protein
MSAPSRFNVIGPNVVTDGGEPPTKDNARLR